MPLSLTIKMKLKNQTEGWKRTKRDGEKWLPKDSCKTHSACTINFHLPSSMPLTLCKHRLRILSSCFSLTSLLVTVEKPRAQSAPTELSLIITRCSLNGLPGHVSKNERKDRGSVKLN